MVAKGTFGTYTVRILLMIVGSEASLEEIETDRRKLSLLSAWKAFTGPVPDPRRGACRIFSRGRLQCGYSAHRRVAILQLAPVSHDLWYGGIGGPRGDCQKTRGLHQHEGQSEKLMNAWEKLIIILTFPRLAL